MIDIKNIILRPAERKDAFPVTELLRRTGLFMPEDKDIDSHWDRLWTNNPSYKDFLSLPHYGWVMEYQNRIVGYFGCFQRTYYLNRKLLQADVSSQWGVEKEFRKFTLLLCEKYFTENPIDFKLNTTAQDASGLIFESFGGGKKVPSDELREVYVIPFHLYGIIKHRFNRIFEKV